MTRKSYTSQPDGPPDPFPFELDGVEFVATGQITTLDLAAVMRLSQFSIVHPEAAGAVNDLFYGALGETEYERFKLHLRQHGTDADVFVDIMRDMIAHYGSRPTRRSRPSSPGPLQTPTTSPVDLPSSDTELTDEQIANFRKAIDEQTRTPN